jgi:hypothetical protein
MKIQETSRNADSPPEGFFNTSLWSVSFYTDNSLNLLRSRFNELLLERKRQAEGAKTLVRQAEANLHSTVRRFAV